MSGNPGGGGRLGKVGVRVRGLVACCIGVLLYEALLKGVAWGRGKGFSNAVIDDAVAADWTE